MDKRPDVMFGKYDPTMFDSTGQTLLVNDIFYSIQGEGRYAGAAAVFVRLAKCNLKCAFCDTEFETGKVLTIKEIFDTITQQVSSLSRHLLIVLTGGEPALQNCGPLIEYVKHRAFLQGSYIRFHVETSGSVWNTWMRNADFVTVSPKVQKKSIPEELIRMIVEWGLGQFKWIVNQSFDTMYARDPESVYVKGAYNCLQPESLKPEWTSRAIELVKRHPDRYTLSLQMHKLAGVP